MDLRNTKIWVGDNKTLRLKVLEKLMRSNVKNSLSLSFMIENGAFEWFAITSELSIVGRISREAFEDSVGTEISPWQLLGDKDGWIKNWGESPFGGGVNPFDIEFELVNGSRNIHKQDTTGITCTAWWFSSEGYDKGLDVQKWRPIDRLREKEQQESVSDGVSVGQLPTMNKPNGLVPVSVRATREQTDQLKETIAGLEYQLQAKDKEIAALNEEIEELRSKGRSIYNANLAVMDKWRQ